MRPKTAIFLLLLLVSARAADLSALDAYCQKALKDWNVPGFSIAIVEDGKVLVARGYGVRELNKPEPVTENTLFAIASNSKAFTAGAIAILVNDKNRRHPARFKSGTREIAAKRPGSACILDVEPLNVGRRFRHAGIGGRVRGRRGLRHDFRTDGGDRRSHRPCIYSNTLQEFAAVESSINIEVNQILNLFMIGFGWALTVHNDLLVFSGFL